jgi:hypothetical protein
MQAHLLVRLVLLQPFYDSRMNDLKAAGFASTAATGLFTAAIVFLRRCDRELYNLKDGANGFFLPNCKEQSNPIINDSTNNILTAIMYVVLIASFFGGAALSASRRRWILQRALSGFAVDPSERGGPKTYLEILQENGPTRDQKIASSNEVAELRKRSEALEQRNYSNSGVPNIPSDVMWQHIDELFIHGIGVSPSQKWQAHHVELGARLLLMQNRYDFGTRQPPQHVKDIAEHMFKRGLQLLPQSPYLMLQFLSYTVAYPADVSALNSAIFAFEHFEEHFASEISVFEAWLLFRRLRDLQVAKRRQVATAEESEAVESINNDVEGAKLTRAGRESTAKYISVVRSIWKRLLFNRRQEARQKEKKESSGRMVQLAVMIENAWDCEEAASIAYNSLLARLSTARIEELTIALSGYAVFLRRIKGDHALAAEVGERAEYYRAAASGSAKGQSDSDSASQKLSLDGLLIVEDQTVTLQVTERLKFKLRIVTGTIAVVSTVLFFTFQALIGRYQGTLVSLVESGNRRACVHDISAGT